MAPSVAQFPMPDKPKPYVTDMQLSLLVGEVLDVMNRAAELQGGQPIPTSTAEMLIRMVAPGAEEKAARAAERAGQMVIAHACDEVAEREEDHSAASAIIRAIYQVEKKSKRAPEAALLTYWKALHFPHYYCQCGKSFTGTHEAERGVCEDCTAAKRGVQ